MLASGMSQLGRTADGLQPAYLALTLAGTDLGNADPLAAFPHLQTLALPNNRLVEIRALGCLRHLTALDVSGNKLTQVLDLRLPADGSGPHNLRAADFSRNALDMLRDLSPFSRLTRLTLAHNRIERVGSGLRPLTLLKVLDLSHNHLVSCRGLEGLSSLVELRLEHNRLQSLEPLAGLGALQVLCASHNRLTHLRGLERAASLRTLDVGANALGRLEELAAVRGASLLSALTVAGNPLDRAMSLRLHVVYLLPQVVCLDGVAVESKEKVLAANMHGADAEGLRLIRRKFFPNGELDDGGGAIPPLAAGLVASQADEEAAADGAERAALLRLDAWAASVRPEAVLAPGATLVTLADTLASVCAPTRPGSALTAAGTAATAPSGAQAGPGPGSSLSMPRTGGRSSGGVPGGAVAAAGSGAGAGAGALSPGQAQLQRARVCWRWVVHHCAAGAALERSWDVDAPLFAPAGAQSAAAERALLGATSGTWAERVAWLFTQLCRACELEAVAIPGYWKHARLPPGQPCAAHNHCWAGVKVAGRWRLVDPAAAALAGGHVPFFVPPDAFIYSYWPLEAAWQLLPEPLSQEVWWQLPYASVAFFAAGCQLGDARLAAVNELPPAKEGGVLPAFQLALAAPRTRGAHLAQRLLECGSGRVVAEWPPRGEPGPPATAFQQVVAGPRGSLEVRFGAHTHLAVLHQLWASPPRPGAYELHVSRVTELPGGGLTLRVEGLGAPLRLRLVEEELLLRVKVVVPPVVPHEAAEDGILHDPAVLRTPLPASLPAFTALGCQLMCPPPSAPLEADRSEPFHVVVPGASRLALAYRTPAVAWGQGEGAQQLLELPAVEEQEGCGAGEAGRFATSLQVPRCSGGLLGLLAFVHDPGLQACAWVPLLQWRVLPQSQHLTFSPAPEDPLELDPDDPYVAHARELFTAMDKDLDGRVTRREILAAFRRNRQRADLLKCPARIRHDDGTFDAFVDVFLQIDSDRLGSFSFGDLAAHLGITPMGGSSSSGEDEDYESGEGEDGEEEDMGEDGGEGEPLGESDGAAEGQHGL